jgi:hypothetical protein
MPAAVDHDDPVWQYLTSTLPLYFQISQHEAATSIHRWRSLIWAHHRYTRIATYFWAKDGRLNERQKSQIFFDLVQLLTSITLSCFVLAVLYDLQYPVDDGFCELQRDEASCLGRKTILDPFQSECRWRPPEDYSADIVIQESLAGRVINTLDVGPGANDDTVQQASCTFVTNNNSLLAFLLSFVITSCVSSIVRMMLSVGLNILSSPPLPPVPQTQTQTQTRRKCREEGDIHAHAPDVPTPRHEHASTMLEWDVWHDRVGLCLSREREALWSLEEEVAVRRMHHRLPFWRRLVMRRWDDNRRRRRSVEEWASDNDDDENDDDDDDEEANRGRPSSSTVRRRRHLHHRRHSWQQQQHIQHIQHIQQRSQRLQQRTSSSSSNRRLVQRRRRDADATVSPDMKDRKDMEDRKDRKDMTRDDLLLHALAHATAALKASVLLRLLIADCFLLHTPPPRRILPTTTPTTMMTTAMIATTTTPTMTTTTTVSSPPPPTTTTTPTTTPLRPTSSRRWSNLTPSLRRLTSTMRGHRTGDNEDIETTSRNADVDVDVDVANTRALDEAKRHVFLLAVYRAFPPIRYLPADHWSRYVVLGLLGAVNGGAFYYIIAKAAVRGVDWQVSFLRASLWECFSDMIVSQAIEIVVFDYWLCTLVDADVFQSLADVYRVCVDAIAAGTTDAVALDPAVSATCVSAQLAERQPLVWEAQWIRGALAAISTSSSSSSSTSSTEASGAAIQDPSTHDAAIAATASLSSPLPSSSSSSSSLPLPLPSSSSSSSPLPLPFSLPSSSSTRNWRAWIIHTLATHSLEFWENVVFVAITTALTLIVYGYYALLVPCFHKWTADDEFAVSIVVVLAVCTIAILAVYRHALTHHHDRERERLEFRSIPTSKSRRRRRRHPWKIDDATSESKESDQAEHPHHQQHQQHPHRGEARNEAMEEAADDDDDDDDNVDAWFPSFGTSPSSSSSSSSFLSLSSNASSAPPRIDRATESRAFREWTSTSISISISNDAHDNDDDDDDEFDDEDGDDDSDDDDDDDDDDGDHDIERARRDAPIKLARDLESNDHSPSWSWSSSASSFSSSSLASASKRPLYHQLSTNRPFHASKQPGAVVSVYDSEDDDDTREVEEEEEEEDRDMDEDDDECIDEDADYAWSLSQSSSSLSGHSDWMISLSFSH